MYYLQNNVEIVRGAQYYCIYDLNNKKLYHLDQEYVNYIEKLTKFNKESISQVPQEAIDYLLSSGLIVSSKNQLSKARDKYSFQGNMSLVWIEITQNCNLKCKHCYEGASRERKTKEMSLEMFKYAIDRILNLGVKRIQLVGGEPLSHHSIAEMIRYVSGKFDFIEIFSNLTLLTDSLLDLIKENNISLASSIYSADPTIHDSVTQTMGSYQLTKNNLDKVSAMGIKIRTASVEMKGVPHFKISNKSIVHRSDLPRLTGNATLALYSDDMLLRKLITKKTFRKPIDPEVFYKNKTIHNCFGEKLYIDCDLNVFPCAMERRLEYGNLKVCSDNELLNNEIRFLNKDKVTVCRDCEYRYACYDCRPDSNNSPVYSKPWNCTYDPYSGEWEKPEYFIKRIHNIM